MQRLVLLTTGLVCFCAGALYGWSALIGPLQEAFSVSTAQSGLVFSLAIVSFSLAVLAVPYLPNVLNPSRKLAVLAIAGTLCVVFAARATSYGLFVFWFSGGFGAVSGALYILALSLASRSAAHRVATPVMVALFGAGGAVFGPLWRVLAEQEWGLGALFILAFSLAGAGALAFIVSLLAKDEFAEPKPAIDAAPSLKPSPDIITLIWLTFGFGSIGGLMILGMASRMMDTASASVALASLTLAGIAIGNTAGRLSVAWLVQRMSVTAILFVSVGFAFMGFCFALSGVNAWALAIGLMCIATGYGVLASAIPSVTRHTVGAEHFQTIYAVIFTAWGIAGLCAPWIAGLLFDAYGSFTLPILSALAATLICTLLAMRLHWLIDPAPISPDT